MSVFRYVRRALFVVLLAAAASLVLAAEPAAASPPIACDYDVTYALGGGAGVSCQTGPDEQGAWYRVAILCKLDPSHYAGVVSHGPWLHSSQKGAWSYAFCSPDRYLTDFWVDGV